MMLPQDISSEELREIIQNLQIALQETQSELSKIKKDIAFIPWLIGALKYLADDECQYALSETDKLDNSCTCTSCTARGALYRFHNRKPFTTPQ